MDSAMYPCAKCRQNCFSKHWKKHGEPPKVCAFFKSMIGNGFDISLVMPPTFSNKLKSLVGQKFTLEDSMGRKWDVILTCTETEGSLGFVTGWLNFVLDHGIQHGDLLVFYYLSDRHFLVEIYGRTACTKISSSEGIDANRTIKTTRNPIPQKRSYDSLDEQSASEKHFHASFSGPNIDVTPSPEKVSNEKEPVSDNLEELFFMTQRDINFTGEGDRDRLFDLSEFEKPVKKPTIDEEEERNYLQDLALLYLPESDTFQNAGTEAGHGDLRQCLVRERETEVLSECTAADFLMHERTPHSSNSPNDSVPLDSIKRQQTIHKSENLDLSAPAGLTNQEATAFKQSVYGNVMADNSVGASDSRSEQSYRNPGETLIHTMKVEGGKMRPIHQEARAFKQEMYGNVMADNNPGATLIHTMKVEGGTSRPIKQEARELKPNISVCPASGCLGANFFDREQTMINCVGEFVKAEPLHRVAPSETGVGIAFPAPPWSEDFQGRRIVNGVLHRLILNNFPSIPTCESLICDENCRGNTPFHIAAEVGDVSVINHLYEFFSTQCGSDRVFPWRMVNKNGNTPAHVALLYGNVAVAMDLVEKDDSLACVTNHFKETLLHLAIKYNVYGKSGKLLR